MRVRVRREECLGCNRCREILNIARQDGIIMMPQLGFGAGHQVNRIEAGAMERLQFAVDECPAGALHLVEE